MGNQKYTLLVFGLGLGLASLLPGCYAHASGGVVYGEPVVYVDSPPERVETYPAADYHGHPAYYADGSWYYRDSGRWVVFRDEPPELRDYRVRTVQRGGPAAVRFREAPRPYAQEAEARRRDQRVDQRIEAQRRADAERQRADAQRRVDDQRRADAERQRADAQRRADDQQRAEAQRRADDQQRAEAQRSTEAARNAAARKRASDKRDRQADEDDNRDPRSPRRRIIPN